MKIKDRIAKLIDVKSIVTFGVIGVYLYLNARGLQVSNAFENMVLMVVTFYYGTQAAKKINEKEI